MFILFCIWSHIYMQTKYLLKQTLFLFHSFTSLDIFSKCNVLCKNVKNVEYKANYDFMNLKLNFVTTYKQNFYQHCRLRSISHSKRLLQISVSVYRQVTVYEHRICGTDDVNSWRMLTQLWHLTRYNGTDQIHLVLTFCICFFPYLCTTLIMSL